MDVVALGESMVTFVPTRPGRLADVPSFDRAIGGAESNVACALAALGHATRWVSRVGADGFGDHLLARIADHGVDVSAVHRDPVRPTGIYFRTGADRATGAHEVAYYRAGSAASAMSAADVDTAAVRACRVLHLSGITAALSPECRELLWQLTAPRAGGPLISFDVNFRPALWPERAEAAVLLELARRADIVFVGADEAAEAWGVTGGAEAIRQVLPEPEVLVVKEGERGATAFARGPLEGAGASTDAVTALKPPTRGPSAARPADVAARRVFEPAPRVQVVSTIGAGDAFAAGFLSATLRGLPVRQRLRYGHLVAAAALTTPTDLAAPPGPGHADRLVALDAPAWGRLRLAPGWTQAERAPEEANPT
ncbi:sugar kinase [Streptomyces sp. F-1]|uniref:sugar kinase n=1 Tax=Streptomyces sp. F-1 TaxID=463642 RepID=UPI000869751F|nr:sugar kinase [Streptomyces sp. F-1]SFY52637.1 2-dehydro-3-deoxygluconokinase [Streptomyces sp. F-1]